MGLQRAPDTHPGGMLYNVERKSSEKEMADSANKAIPQSRKEYKTRV